MHQENKYEKKTRITVSVTWPFRWPPQILSWHVTYIIYNVGSITPVTDKINYKHKLMLAMPRINIFLRKLMMQFLDQRNHLKFILRPGLSQVTFTLIFRSLLTKKRPNLQCNFSVWGRANVTILPNVSISPNLPISPNFFDIYISNYFLSVMNNVIFSIDCPKSSLFNFYLIGFGGVFNYKHWFRRFEIRNFKNKKSVLMCLCYLVEN